MRHLKLFQLGKLTIFNLLNTPVMLEALKNKSINNFITYLIKIYLGTEKETSYVIQAIHLLSDKISSSTTDTLLKIE